MSGKRSSILMSKLAVHWAWIYPAPNFARCLNGPGNRGGVYA